MEETRIDLNKVILKYFCYSQILLVFLYLRMSSFHFHSWRIFLLDRNFESITTFFQHLNMCSHCFCLSWFLMRNPVTWFVFLLSGTLFFFGCLQDFLLSLVFSSWLWHIWVWISLNLCNLGFIDLPEIVSVYLSANLGSFCYSDIFSLLSLFSPFGTLMTWMLDLLILSH